MACRGALPLGGISGSALSPGVGEADCGMRLRVVYLDDHLIVVDKPSGMPSVPARSPCDPPSVIERLRSRFGAPHVDDDRLIEAVHRLDRDTSGLLVIARSLEVRRFLGRSFEERRIGKRYVALTDGELRVPDGWHTLHLPLGVDSVRPPRRLVCPLTGRRATTRFRVLAHGRCLDGRETSLVALEPVTGRSHQLRAHLAWLGRPILGDRLYNPIVDVGRNPVALALHATWIAFPHRLLVRRDDVLRHAVEMFDFHSRPDFTDHIGRDHPLGRIAESSACLQ